MVRFVPGCACCETCDPTAEDQFNRSTLGTDWTVVSGSWSCNGTQLTGSGEIHWTPSGGVDNGWTLKLDSGTLKVAANSLTTDEYFKFGDGKMGYYDGGFLVKEFSDWPSEGQFKFCTRSWYDRDVSLDDNGYGVTSGDDYVAFDTTTANWNAGILLADSTVTIDWIQTFDPTADDCCSTCPACEKWDVEDTPSNQVILVDGAADEFLLDFVAGEKCHYKDSPLNWDVYFYGDGEKHYCHAISSAAAEFESSVSIDNCKSFEVELDTYPTPGSGTVTVKSA